MILITMRILFIFLLSYTNIYGSTSSKDIDITFEMMKGKTEFIDILQKKKKQFNKLGLDCYFHKQKDMIALRCNDSTSTAQLNKNKQLFKRLNLRYKIISLQKSSKKLTLEDGYNFFNNKQYIKAKNIFLKLYTTNKSFETAYALSLIFFHEKKYKRVRNLLKKYKKRDPKCSKLIYDSIVSQYYQYTHVGRDTKALELQKRYIKEYPTLQNLFKPKPKYDLSKGYIFYNNKQYDKALFIFSMLYLKEKTLDNAYALSSVYFKKEQFSQVRKYLESYIKNSEKASKLFYNSIVAQYYNYIKVARNARAIELKNRYIKLYPELKDLAKPTPTYNLKDGYTAYDNKEYDKALFIFSKLYRDQHNIENSYALALVALHNKQYSKVRQYLYYYKKQSKKSAKLYFNSIIDEYNSYLQKKQYMKAVILLKKFKAQYPQLQKMNEALIKEANLLIRDGAYYKAEKLLRENEFQNTRDILFEGIYNKALALQKKGKDVEALKMIVPYVAYYKEASKFYIEISFKLAGIALKNKDYIQAKNILRPIASVSSDAQEFYYKVIYEENLDAGWNSFHSQNYENSLKFFENSCNVSHQYNCIEGIMHSAYKLQDYNIALSSAEEVYLQTNSQDSAFIAYDSAYHLQDEIKSDYWYQLLDLKYKKLAIFKMDITTQKEKIDSLYIDIINQHPNDFELALHYLHFLKDIQHYQDFEQFMKNSLLVFDTKEKQTLLKQLDREYKNRKFTQYFNTKEYQKCFIYGNQILTQEDDAEYKRMHAWCAFHSKHYADAEKIFEAVNLQYGRTVEDTDAQFLSAFNNNDYEKASELLTILYQNTSDEEKYKEYAQYFISMNQLQKAQRVTFNILNKKEREELQLKIKESYKYNRNRIDLFAGGIEFSQRSIEDNLHSFTQYYIPFDIDIYSEKYGHYYVDADIIYMYDEFKADENRSSLPYGLGYLYNKNRSSSNTTFIANTGVKTNYLDIEIGSTPLGVDITPELLGFISLHTYYKHFNFNIKYIKKGTDESLLSSVGEILTDTDNGTDVKWGRVVKTGFELEISYNSEISYSLNIASYPSITGLNIKENSELKTVASISYLSQSDLFTYIDYSFVTVYDSFDFNSDLYTYGHGGYFSPQEFLLGNFEVEIADIVTDNAYWKIKTSIGYEQFSVDSVDEYPIQDSNSEGLSGTVEGYDESGLSYDISLYSSYQFTKKLNLMGHISYEEASSFKDISAGLYLLYYFDKKHKVNLYNLHDFHRVEF